MELSVWTSAAHTGLQHSFFCLSQPPRTIEKSFTLFYFQSSRELTYYKDLEARGRLVICLNFKNCLMQCLFYRHGTAPTVSMLTAQGNFHIHFLRWISVSLSLALQTQITLNTWILLIVVSHNQMHMAKSWVRPHCRLFTKYLLTIICGKLFFIASHSWRSTLVHTEWRWGGWLANQGCSELLRAAGYVHTVWEEFNGSTQILGR